MPRFQFKPRDCQVLFCACFRCNQTCVVPDRPLASPNACTIGCKTRDTLCKFLEYSWWTSHYSWKIYRFPNYPLPSKSMLITLSGTMIISCLVNIVQGGGKGGGGMFYLVFEYSKIRQKRSSVSSVLQPIVAPLPRSALDNGLSSPWSPNVQVGLAPIPRTSKPRFSVGGVPGLFQPSRLSIENISVLRGPHVILCLTGRKCALSWPVSLYWLQFPRLEWWRWGCLLPCPSPWRVVCIRSQGLSWSGVWHKWSLRWLVFWPSLELWIVEMALVQLPATREHGNGVALQFSRLFQRQGEPVIRSSTYKLRGISVTFPGCCSFQLSPCCSRTLPIRNGEEGSRLNTTLLNGLGASISVVFRSRSQWNEVQHAFPSRFDFVGKPCASLRDWSAREPKRSTACSGAPARNAGSR